MSTTPQSLTWRFQRHHRVWLSGFHDTSESDSAVSMTPQSLTQRFPRHHRVWLSGFHDTTESDSAVSMTSQSLIQPYQWHHRVWLSGINDIAESVQNWLTLKIVEKYLQNLEPLYNNTVLLPKNLELKWVWSWNNSGENFLSLIQQCQWLRGVFFTCKYLREIETVCENTSAYK